MPGDLASACLSRVFFDANSVDCGLSGPRCRTADDCAVLTAAPPVEAPDARLSSALLASFTGADVGLLRAACVAVLVRKRTAASAAVVAAAVPDGLVAAAATAVVALLPLLLPRGDWGSAGRSLRLELDSVRRFVRDDVRLSEPRAIAKSAGDCLWSTFAETWRRTSLAGFVCSSIVTPRRRPTNRGCCFLKPFEGERA